jgi:hypothetical protein
MSGLCTRPSRRLTVTYLPLNFVRMSSRIGPSIREVLCGYRGITPKKVGFASAQPAGLHQQPNGNARANNARLATANCRIYINPWGCIAQIARHHLQQLGLFAGRELGHKISQRIHSYFSWQGTDQ